MRTFALVYKLARIKNILSRGGEEGRDVGLRIYRIEKVI